MRFLASCSSYELNLNINNDFLFDWITKGQSKKWQHIEATSCNLNEKFLDPKEIVTSAFLTISWRILVSIHLIEWTRFTECIL